MPVYKNLRSIEPLWKEWDIKAQKTGLRHTVYFVNGDQYKGEWLDNLKHGKGTQIWRHNGAVYDGDWKFDKRNGFGTYSILNVVTGKYKKAYSGWWKNDKRHGYGTAFYSDTEYYEGDWKADKRSGWGRMYFSNGTIYEGEWAGDKYSGKGMLRLGNENRYEGSWKGGKKHGPGKYYYLDKGQLYEGVWVEDIPKCGTMIDYGREEAPSPPIYPIPEIKVRNPVAILEEAKELFLNEQE
uniref:MORN repeat-containing protein 3 n=1 Tax=Geotrypetes seraphini TaxID=260995 RepID=A0A6P8S8B0_GEOSA|nr:MORN repeat-containing protein 3 isoform X2 [Geotrypetes seraphini]